MPITKEFDMAVNGDTVHATVDTIVISGLDGSNIRLFSKVRTRSYHDRVADGVERVDLTVSTDDDGDGTPDLIEAVNTAKAQLGITITPAKLRDLLVLITQIAATNQADRRSRESEAQP